MSDTFDSVTQHQSTMEQQLRRDIGALKDRVDIAEDTVGSRTAEVKQLKTQVEIQADKTEAQSAKIKELRDEIRTLEENSRALGEVRTQERS
ncbi:MAG: hypothetical protein Q9201_006957 [Fulgogasparrea decipioides]